RSNVAMHVSMLFSLVLEDSRRHKAPAKYRFLSYVIDTATAWATTADTLDRGAPPIQSPICTGIFRLMGHRLPTSSLGAFLLGEARVCVRSRQQYNRARWTTSNASPVRDMGPRWIGVQSRICTCKNRAP